MSHQKSAELGVLGKGITSRMFSIPVANCTSLSNPNPNPAWGTAYNKSTVSRKLQKEHFTKLSTGPQKNRVKRQSAENTFRVLLTTWLMESTIMWWILLRVVIWFDVCFDSLLQKDRLFVLGCQPFQVIYSRWPSNLRNWKLPEP